MVLWYRHLDYICKGPQFKFQGNLCRIDGAMTFWSSDKNRRKVAVQGQRSNLIICLPICPGGGIVAATKGACIWLQWWWLWPCTEELVQMWCTKESAEDASVEHENTGHHTDLMDKIPSQFWHQQLQHLMNCALAVTVIYTQFIVLLMLGVSTSTRRWPGSVPTVQYRYYPQQVTVCTGTGTVWENQTCSIPVFNPICTHRYFKFKMPYLDLCRFQPPGDSEPWVKNSWVLEYLWVHRYLEILTGTQYIK